jgi:hypothetical protein
MAARQRFTQRRMEVMFLLTKACNAFIFQRIISIKKGWIFEAN